jgi:hypothetical protein
VYPLPPHDSDGEPVIGDLDYPCPQRAEPLRPGDSDQLLRNPEGSVDIHISRVNPGSDELANWLPAPSGPLGITVRPYTPEPLVRGWLAPLPVRKRT